jgi:hypothetical protein
VQRDGAVFNMLRLNYRWKGESVKALDLFCDACVPGASFATPNEAVQAREVMARDWL